MLLPEVREYIDRLGEQFSEALLEEAIYNQREDLITIETINKLLENSRMNLYYIDGKLLFRSRLKSNG